MSLHNKPICIDCLDVKPFWYGGDDDNTEPYDRYDCILGGKTFRNWDRRIKKYECHCNYDEENAKYYIPNKNNWGDPYCGYDSEEEFETLSDGRRRRRNHCSCGDNYDFMACDCCQICRFTTAYKVDAENLKIMKSLSIDSSKCDLCSKCNHPVYYKYEQYERYYTAESLNEATHCDISIANLHSVVPIKLAKPFYAPKGWYAIKVIKNKKTVLNSEEEKEIDDIVQCIVSLWK
jgi:hypothetical protein